MTAYNKTLVGKNVSHYYSRSPLVLTPASEKYGFLREHLASWFCFSWTSTLCFEKRGKNTFACCCLMDASCLFISFCCVLYSKINTFFLAVLGSCNALGKDSCWLVPFFLLKRSPNQQSLAPASNTYSNKWDAAQK